MPSFRIDMVRLMHKAKAANALDLANDDRLAVFL